MANIARLLSITARSTEIATKTVAKNADKLDDVVEVAKKVANATPKVTKGLSEIGAKFKEKTGKFLSEVFQKSSNESDDAMESLLKIHGDPNVHFQGGLEEAIKINSKVQANTYKSTNKMLYEISTKMSSQAQIASHLFRLWK